MACVRELVQSGLQPAQCRLISGAEAALNGANKDFSNVLLLGFESGMDVDWAPHAAACVKRATTEFHVRCVALRACVRCLALPCLALPCLALPCLALPCVRALTPRVHFGGINLEIVFAFVRSV